MNSQTLGTQQPDTVEVVGAWFKSSRSNTLQNLNCVEVAPNTLGGLSVRDSKAKDANGDHSGPVLHFTRGAMTAFFADIAPRTV